MLRKKSASPVELTQACLNLKRLERLIELKLASGMTASRRLRDLADVLDLIRALRLPANFAVRLDESVGATYHQLWQQAQTPDPIHGV